MRRVGREASREMKKIILLRTRKGKFGPKSRDSATLPEHGRVGSYNRDYAERRKGGRRRPVTLFDTGSMLSALHAGSSYRGATITAFVEQRGTAGDKQKARWHNTTGAGPGGAVRRQFLYINLRETKQVLRKVSARIPGVELG